MLCEGFATVFGKEKRRKQLSPGETGKGYFRDEIALDRILEKDRRMVHEI